MGLERLLLLMENTGVDITFLGLAQADKHGNLNVSKFGNRPTGPGGFIDITNSAKKIVFAGTFMAKAKEHIEDGKLVIDEEGTAAKFVDEVEQITFAGQYARPDQTVLYVTERAVFKLIDGKVTLIEIAPGIDMEKDVLAHMGFRPEISPDLKLMNPDIFQEKWGKLGDFLDE